MSRHPLPILLLAVSALAACASAGGPQATEAPPVASSDAAAFTPPVIPDSGTMDFGTCVADLKQKAVANGIPYQVTDDASPTVRPKPPRLELDRSQPAFSQP